VADPRVRILLTVVYVVCVGMTPPGAWVRMGLYAVMLAIGVCGWHVAPKDLLLRMTPVAGLVVAALLGMAFSAPWQTSLDIAVRLTLMSAAAVVLSLSLPTTTLLAGLRSLGTPATAITLLSVTARYIHVTGEEVVRVRRAWESRAFGATNLRKVVSLGRAATALVRRGSERSERIAWAMVSRGFTGQIPCRPLPRLRVIDAMAALVAAACMICIAVA